MPYALSATAFRRLAHAALLLAAVPAASAATRFDGAWKVTLRCPPHQAADDDAKGYTHRFAGEVHDGVLRAVHGQEGEPGWHLLQGPIAEDGGATLRLQGIVSNAAYAIRDAARGKPYSYRVKAQFDADRGSGQRLTGRVCTFTFER